MNYKYKLLILVLWCTYAAQLYTMVPETTKEASKRAWNFELYNKMDTINVSGWYRDTNEMFIRPTTVPRLGMIRTITDNKRHIVLSITNINGYRRIFVINGCPVPGSCHATRFVSFNQKNEIVSLRPQTGPLLGILGVTESGLALDHKTNIQLSGITEEGQGQEEVFEMEQKNIKRKGKKEIK